MVPSIKESVKLSEPRSDGVFYIYVTDEFEAILAGAGFIEKRVFTEVNLMTFRRQRGDTEITQYFGRGHLVTCAEVADMIRTDVFRAMRVETADDLKLLLKNAFIEVPNFGAKVFAGL
jgi:hypothetical protein